MCRASKELCILIELGNRVVSFVVHFSLSAFHCTEKIKQNKGGLRCAGGCFQNFCHLLFAFYGVGLLWQCLWNKFTFGTAFVFHRVFIRNRNFEHLESKTHYHCLLKGTICKLHTAMSPVLSALLNLNNATCPLFVDIHSFLKGLQK